MNFKLGKFFLALLLAIGICTHAFAQSRRNVQIQVEIKNVGFSNRDGSVMVFQNPGGTQTPAGGGVGEISTPLYEERNTMTTQFMVVSDGAEASLFVGEEVPRATWYKKYLLEEGYITEAVEFRSVGTSLKVSPVIMGNQIQVTLTPEISYETEKGTGRIAITKLSTTVIVPDGESMQVGGSSAKSEFENTFYRGQSGEGVKIILTPKIME